MRIRTQCIPSTRAVIFPTARSSHRTFSTTPSCLAALEGAHKLNNLIPRNAEIPPYPYGEALWYKQSNRGLYGNARVQFGNNVSHDTETKTRRKWSPNVHSKALYSIALKKRIKLRVHARVLRTIDKEGGLDEYILGGKESRIKELGPEGWRLKWLLLQRPEIKERLKAEAVAMGIPEDVATARWDPPKPQRKRLSKEEKEAMMEAAKEAQRERSRQVNEALKAEEIAKQAAKEEREAARKAERNEGSGWFSSMFRRRSQ